MMQSERPSEPTTTDEASTATILLEQLQERAYHCSVGELFMDFDTPRSDGDTLIENSSCSSVQKQDTFCWKDHKRAILQHLVSQTDDESIVSRNHETNRPTGHPSWPFLFMICLQNQLSYNNDPTDFQNNILVKELQRQILLDNQLVLEKRTTATSTWIPKYRFLQEWNTSQRYISLEYINTILSQSTHPNHTSLLWQSCVSEIDQYVRKAMSLQTTDSDHDVNQTSLLKQHPWNSLSVHTWWMNTSSYIHDLALLIQKLQDSALLDPLSLFSQAEVSFLMTHIRTLIKSKKSSSPSFCHSCIFWYDELRNRYNKEREGDSTLKQLSRRNDRWMDDPSPPLHTRIADWKYELEDFLQEEQPTDLLFWETCFGELHAIMHDIFVGMHRRPSRRSHPFKETHQQEYLTSILNTLQEVSRTMVVFPYHRIAALVTQVLEWILSQPPDVMVSEDWNKIPRMIVVSATAAEADNPSSAVRERIWREVGSSSVSSHSFRNAWFDLFMEFCIQTLLHEKSDSVSAMKKRFEGLLSGENRSCLFGGLMPFPHLLLQTTLSLMVEQMHPSTARDDMFQSLLQATKYTQKDITHESSSVTLLDVYESLLRCCIRKDTATKANAPETNIDLVSSWVNTAVRLFSILTRSITSRGNNSSIVEACSWVSLLHANSVLKSLDVSSTLFLFHERCIPELVSYSLEIFNNVESALESMCKSLCEVSEWKAPFWLVEIFVESLFRQDDSAVTISLQISQYLVKLWGETVVHVVLSSDSDWIEIEDSVLVDWSSRYRDILSGSTRAKMYLPGPLPQAPNRRKRPRLATDESHQKNLRSPKDEESSYRIEDDDASDGAMIEATSDDEILFV